MKRIKRTISVLLSIVMLFTLLPTTALAVTQSVSFQISHSNGASGTVSYRFGSEENFTDVVLNDGGAASVNVPNEATTITVKAVPAEGYAINQSHSGVYTSGSCTTRFDFDALAGENGFAYTLTDDSPQFQIEFDNNDGTGGDGGDGEGGESGDSLTIELSGSTSVSGGTFSYTNGTARVMFVRGENGEGAYDSSERQITLDNDVTAVKIILSADEGYTGVLRTGGNNPPVPDPTVKDGESTYIFERSALEAAGSLVAFNIEFTGGSGGDYPGPDPEPDWYTVSWDGGNVTVENGTVLAERVRVAAHDDQPETIYTAIASEYNASADDHVFSLMDTIGKEKENENDPDALQLYGLGFSPSDLFIAKDLSGVSIDFKFVPDYGYQLSDILTNETDSLLSGFTASASEISSFNFAVRPGSNVHFNVVFSKAEDTIQNNSSTVTSATIANGQNAATSGNLKMTIADLDEEAVSDDLKAKAGESALYLDMNLYQVVSKGGENGNWENQLEDLSNTITVTLSVPAPAEGSSYYIIREHGDGENKTYSRIAVAYDPATGTITFETDKFSNYALAQAADNVTTDTDVQNADKVTAAGISTNYAWADTLPESAESATAVKLTVANNSDVAADVQASLKNAAGVTVDETKSFYLDITMTATVSGSDTSITNLRQPVTVALTVPAILASEKYTVVRAHTDGSNTTYEKLSSSYDRTSSALTFQTDRFSIYAIYVSPAYTITYILTFDSNGGSAIGSISETSGTTIDLSKYQPTKEGFTFAGWFSDATLTTKVTSVKLTKNTTVYAKWKDSSECPSKAFTDLNTSAWYHPYIDYVLENGLMEGYGNKKFGPDDSLTRAQFAQILYNKDGGTAVKNPSIFTDVVSGAWYYDAVAWAAESGVVEGYGDGKFGPDDPITREQLAVMFWRYAGRPKAEGTLDSFTDLGKASGYALDALRWAVEQGIIQGKGNGILDPAGRATRAEVAAMLQRFLETAER